MHRQFFRGTSPIFSNPSYLLFLHSPFPSFFFVTWGGRFLGIGLFRLLHRLAIRHFALVFRPKGLEVGQPGIARHINLSCRPQNLIDPVHPVAEVAYVAAVRGSLRLAAVSRGVS